jgi:hypothetical protein
VNRAPGLCPLLGAKQPEQPHATVRGWKPAAGRHHGDDENLFAAGRRQARPAAQRVRLFSRRKQLQPGRVARRARQPKAHQGRNSPTSYKDFIRISSRLSTTCLFRV